MALSTKQIKRLNRSMVSMQTEVEIGTLLSEIQTELFGVSTYAGLVTAVADANRTTIILKNNITLEGQVVINHGLTIIGNGHSLVDATLDASQYIALQIMADGVTIDNVKFEISGDSDVNTLYSIDVYGPNSTIKNCTFVMANAGSSGSLSIYYEDYAGHYLLGNTLSNGVAFTGGTELVRVKYNTFAATKGFGLGVATIGGIAYTVADDYKLSQIIAYLIGENNITIGFATTLNVESYL